MEFVSKSHNTYECKWRTEYNILRGKVIARYKELSELQKIYDKKVAECTHFLELEKPNAATHAKTTKILIDTLKARREIKNEFMDIQTVFEAMKNALKKEIEQGYTYSEDFLTEVFGEEN